MQDPANGNIFYFDFGQGLWYWTNADGEPNAIITAEHPSQIKIDLHGKEVFFRHDASSGWEFWGTSSEMDAIIRRYRAYLEREQS